MKFNYNSVADTLNILFVEEKNYPELYSETITIPIERMEESVFLDFDNQNHILGMEILCASQFFSKNSLNNSSITISYNKESNVAYLRFLVSDANSLTTESFEIEKLVEFGTINIDFDENEKIFGIEILNADKHLPESLLKKIL